uniref:Purine-binding chemotaxis protein CheW n=1 Tax=Dictyoglomus thermophilum TaxID=14 RepID=A0A7C3MPR3_DICTH
MFYIIDEENSYVVFKIGETFYDIKSKYIQQIEMVENITLVPNATPYVDGVTLSRGKVIPVINLRARMGLERIPYDIKTRMIVIKIEDKEVGLIVDSAREYISIPPDKIQESFENIFGISEKFLEGIANLGDRLILILNPKEILKEGGLEDEKEKK